MRKVYCKNCRYGIAGTWSWSKLLCEVEGFLVDGSSRICPYYQRKWWKFWVKKK